MENSLEAKNHQPFRIMILVGMVIATTCLRFFSPFIFSLPFNFSPVNAIALFSGAYFVNRSQAFLVPILSIWVSDLFLNYLYMGHFVAFYDGFYWQYLSYMLIVLIGALLKGKIRPLSIVVGSLSGSILFFLISNFGTWVSYDLYPSSFSGLMLCYEAGVPFFRSTVISDLLFSLVLFGTWEYAGKHYPALAKA